MEFYHYEVGSKRGKKDMNTLFSLAKGIFAILIFILKEFASDLQRIEDLYERILENLYYILKILNLNVVF